MTQIELKTLQKTHPKLFLPSKRRELLANVIGIAGIVLGSTGFIFEAIVALLSPGPGLNANPISIVICVIMFVGGIRILRAAPDLANKSGWTPFAKRCQAIYDEIDENGYAQKHATEFNQCKKYALEELIEVFETMNREDSKERFETISFLIKEKLRGRS